jgi:hypothetical protein
LLKGFLLTWLVLIFAEPSAFMLVTKIGAGAAVIPPLAIIVIGSMLRVRDKSRTGTGRRRDLARCGLFRPFLQRKLRQHVLS